MLKLAILCSLLAMAGATSASAADRWIVVSSDTRGGVWLVDIQTISASQAWVVAANPFLTYDKSGGYFYTYMYSRKAFDCTGRRSKSLSLEHKDASGRSLWDSGQYSGEWSYVQPDTVNEGALDYVCGKRDPAPLTFASPEDALRATVLVAAKEAR